MNRALSFLFGLACSWPLFAAEATVGSAQVDITPSLGTPMAGYYAVRTLEGVLDPLYAKAIVIEKDGVRAAIVSLDLLTTTPGLVSESRAKIESATGIPAKHVMISATHSHTGPVLADRARDDAFGGEHKLSVEYRKNLPGKIAEAVRKADASREAAIISTAIGKEDGLAFNRRYHMTDGSVGWNPGKLNPKIVRPAGPTDPSVPLVVFEVEKQPLACFVNFAMHSDTTGGKHASADYPVHLTKALQAAKNETMTVSFLMGCSGDVNHVNVKLADLQKGRSESSRIGTRLAAAALKAWDERTPIIDGPLRITSETVELPLAPHPQVEIDAAKPLIAAVIRGDKPAPKFLDQVQAFKIDDVARRLGKPWSVEVQVISLGPDLAWVSFPGEIFTQLGLDLKAGSPFKTTMIAELANGSLGYIPNRLAYAQGQYEVVSSRCAEGSGEKLVANALGQLRKHFWK